MTQFTTTVHVSGKVLTSRQLSCCKS